MFCETGFVHIPRLSRLSLMRNTWFTRKKHSSYLHFSAPTQAGPEQTLWSPANQSLKYPPLEYGVDKDKMNKALSGIFG
jgi:hypothetical protein